MKELLSGDPQEEEYFLIQTWNENMQTWEFSCNVNDNRSAHRYVNVNPTLKLRIFLVIKEYKEVRMWPETNGSGDKK